MKIPHLSGYEWKTDLILEWTKDGWISDEQFDVLAAQTIRNPPRKIRVRGFNGDDYILPSMVGHPKGEAGDWIFLVQSMVHSGHVRAKKEGERVYYTSSPTAS